MEEIKILLYEQTEILLGNRKNYSTDYFENTEINERYAIEFVRMMARTFLRCYSLDAAKMTVSMDMLERLKLRKVINKIEVPFYVLPEDQDKYLIDKIFTPGFDSEEWGAEKFCEHIERGTLKKFPKYYMETENGKMRAERCLGYFLRRDFLKITVLQLYRLSIGPDFRKYLKEHLLWNACRKHYDDPVEFLSESLGERLKVPALETMYRAVYDMDFKSDIKN